MEERIKEIEKEIATIKERNLRVEADKAWETSKFRVLSITVITYIIASVVLFLLNAKNFLLSALVPTIGYFLSMQSLPAIKKWWVKKFLKQKR